MEEKDENKVVVHKAVITTEENDKNMTISELLFEWAGTVFVSIEIVMLILTFFMRQVTVSGSSMTDTLQSGDKLMVSSFMYTPKNGDIVVCNSEFVGALYMTSDFDLDDYFEDI